MTNISTRIALQIAAVMVSTCMLTACSRNPVKTVDADTYQLSRTVSKAASAESIKDSLKTLGRARCADFDNAPFHVVSEDATVKGARQTVTLTYQCKSILKASSYTSNHPAVERPQASDTATSVFEK